MLANRRVARSLLVINSLLVCLATYAAIEPAPRQPPVATPPALAYPTIPLEGTLVHLRRDERDATERHASVQLDLELDDRGDVAAVVQHMSALRESVLAYFSDRSAGELKAPGSQARIKEELLPRLNRLLPAPKIRALYVTQFVVQ